MRVTTPFPFPLVDVEGGARERGRHSLEASPPAAGTPDPWTWAALMRRVFDLDVLACPRCGGRPRVIATVQDSLAVCRPSSPTVPAPAPPRRPAPPHPRPPHT